MANVTKEFLEMALGRQVQKFEISSGSNLGDGYTSLLYTIDLTLDDSDATKCQSNKVLHLLLKCYPTNAGRQEFLTQANIFNKELCVYNTMIPEFINFQKIHNPQAEIIKPPVPGFVYGRAVNYKMMAESESKYCSDPLDNCIIMSDLRNKKNGGFRLANRLIGFDLDHSKLVVEAQAKFHALSWAYKKVKKIENFGDKMDFLSSSFLDDMDETMFNVMYDSSFGLARGAIELKVKDQITKDKFFNSLDRARSIAQDVMVLYFSDTKRPSDPNMTKDNALRIAGETKPNEVPWLAVLHGDAWLNNMLFRYDEETGRPLEVILVDLQLTREGDPLNDVVYSIFTSTTSAFRKQHLNELLKLYADTFNGICTHFNVDPFPDFTFSELQRRFNRTKLFGFYMALVGFPIFLNDPKDAQDFENIKEDSTASDFFKEFAESTQKVGGSERYRDRVIDLITEFVEEGIV